MEVVFSLLIVQVYSHHVILSMFCTGEGLLKPTGCSPHPPECSQDFSPRGTRTNMQWLLIHLLAGLM